MIGRFCYFLTKISDNIIQFNLGCFIFICLHSQILLAAPLTFYSLSELGCGPDDPSKLIPPQLIQYSDPESLYQFSLYYYKNKSQCETSESYQNLIIQITEWLKTAAEKKHLMSQRYLASLYIDELGDLSKGIYWLQQAELQNSPEAKFILASAYNYGEGVAQDSKKALKLLEQSAELKYAPAQFELALFYQYDISDFSKAAYWYQEAAQQGLSAAQFNLGLFYQDGLGVTQDIDQAIYWFKRAAQQENSDAQNNLGTIYENGKGVAVNLSLAEKWYQHAAQQGDSIAQSNLGILYFNHHQELGIPDGLIRSYAWLGTAIYNGNALAREVKKNIFYQLPYSKLIRARELMNQYIDNYHTNN